MMKVESSRITKYINRERSIPEEQIRIIERKLKFPRKYWLDEKRKCIPLTEERQLEIDKILANEEMNELWDIDDELEKSMRTSDILSYDMLSDCRIEQRSALLRLNKLIWSAKTDGNCDYESEISRRINILNNLVDIIERIGIDSDLWSYYLDAYKNFFAMNKQEKEEFVKLHNVNIEQDFNYRDEILAKIIITEKYEKMKKVDLIKELAKRDYRQLIAKRENIKMEEIEFFESLWGKEFWKEE